MKLVLKSPGLSPMDERIAGPLRRAAESGVPVQGELDLFARALADLKAERGYAPKVLAITGTNGKTTTTAMAAMLVARRQACRGGRQHRADDAADLGGCADLEPRGLPAESPLARALPGDTFPTAWGARRHALEA